MKVALVGYGYWGINLAKTINANPNLELYSIFDLSKERISTAKEQYSFKEFQSYEELLGDDSIEAIFIATPPQSHYQVAYASLEAGKHTFVEKPYTTSLEEAYALINLAEKKSLITMVDHVFVYSEPVKYLKSNIQKFGDIVYINARRINLGLFQSAVDVLWDLAVHDLSIIDYLVGLDIKRVSAFTKKYGSFPNSAFGDVNIELQNGILIGLNVSWLSPIKIREMIIGGTKLTALYDDTKQDKIKLYNAGVVLNEEFGKAKLYEKMVQYKYGEEEIPKISNKMSLDNSVEFFYDSIVSKKIPMENHRGIISVIKTLELISKIG
ncbi:MAG: Gfo/Idh/MocA family oxidoreductase [Helicobacter sp.]|uniref:Gfo/Idh/MocA family protein n=1 Tax=Helicobacter sp. TaxID=218 RepID=UPI002A91074D|nr:Gfo/Idh/MocA family oxidoreductase [Helicobacter sp.]MDY5616183.1 Gfo/Idh/MocA family oxidoreductase [Helicobacter sp.]